MIQVPDYCKPQASLSNVRTNAIGAIRAIEGSERLPVAEEMLHATRHHITWRLESSNTPSKTLEKTHMIETNTELPDRLFVDGKIIYRPISETLIEIGELGILLTCDGPERHVHFKKIFMEVWMSIPPLQRAVMHNFWASRRTIVRFEVLPSWSRRERGEIDRCNLGLSESRLQQLLCPMTF